MRFWDSSAIVPLVVEEPASALCRGWLRDDREMMTWALSATEATSAVRRKQRLGEIGEQHAGEALGRLAMLASNWTEVQALERVHDRAHRLLAIHDLRAADSLQLAAALTATSDRPQLLPFVCFDDRLATAARREGFSVLDPSYRARPGSE